MYRIVLAVMMMLPAMIVVGDETATTQGSDKALLVQLPAGWVAKKPTVFGVSQYAENPESVCSFELVAEPKSDFDNTVDLRLWAKLVKEGTASRSTLVNRKETDLQEAQIGGQDVLEYEVTGELNHSKLHYRFLLLHIGNWFYKITCWCSPSHWDAAQAKFDELVGNLK